MTLEGKMIRYTTRKTWPPFPVGTECYVTRSNGTLKLVFDDGTVIEAPANFYAEGLEAPRTAEARAEFMLAY